MTKRKRALSPRVSEILQDTNGNLPIWIRAPVRGPEHFSGCTRPKLYQLAGNGHIRSVSIREPGQVKGTRLFHLGSILDYIAKLEKQALKSDHEEAVA